MAVVIASRLVASVEADISNFERGMKIAQDKVNVAANAMLNANKRLEISQNQLASAQIKRAGVIKQLSEATEKLSKIEATKARISELMMDTSRHDAAITKQKTLIESLTDKQERLTESINKQTRQIPFLKTQIDRATLSYQQMLYQQEKFNSGRFIKTIDDIRTGIRRLSDDAMRVGTSITTALSGPLLIGGKVLLDYQEKVFKTGLSLESLYGSGKVAEKVIREIENLAAKTNFSFEDLLPNIQKLGGVGVASEKLVPMMKDIANGIAAVGGNAEKLDQLTYAFQRLIAEGKVSRLVFRSLYLAGMNPLKILSEGLGKSVEEVSSMVSKGLIKSNVAIELFLQNLRDKAPELLEKMAQGVEGRWSNTIDYLKQTGRVIFDPLYKATVTTLDNVQRRLEQLREYARTWSEATKKEFVAVFLSLASIGPAIIAFAVGLKVLTALTSPISLLGLAVGGLTYIFLTNKELLDEFKNTLLENKDFALEFGKSILTLGKNLAQDLVPLLKISVTVLGQFLHVVKSVIDLFNALPAPIRSTIIMTTAFTVAARYLAFTIGLSNGQGLIGSIGMAIVKIKDWTIATRSATIMTGSLRTGLLTTLGPLNLYTIAFAAVVAVGWGLYELYKHTLGPSIEEITKKKREEAQVTLELANRKVEELEKVKPLVVEYKRLSSITEQTKEQKEKLKKVISDISDLSPTLVAQYDSQGNAISLLRDEVDKLTTSYSEAAEQARRLSQAQVNAGQAQDIAQTLDSKRELLKTWQQQMRNLMGPSKEQLNSVPGLSYFQSKETPFSPEKQKEIQKTAEIIKGLTKEIKELEKQSKEASASIGKVYNVPKPGSLGAGFTASDRATSDIKKGLVNKSILDMLNQIYRDTGLQAHIYVAKSGHNKNVKGKNVTSNHWFGNAIDINAINGVDLGQGNTVNSRGGILADKFVSYLRSKGFNRGEGAGSNSYLWRQGGHYDHIHMSMKGRNADIAKQYSLPDISSASKKDKINAVKKEISEFEKMMNSLTDTNKELTKEVTLGSQATKTQTMIYEYGTADLSKFTAAQKKEIAEIQRKNIEMSRYVEIKGYLDNIDNSIAVKRLSEEDQAVVSLVGSYKAFAALDSGQINQIKNKIAESEDIDRLKEYNKAIKDIGVNIKQLYETPETKNARSIFKSDNWDKFSDIQRKNILDMLKYQGAVSSLQDTISEMKKTLNEAGEQTNTQKANSFLEMTLGGINNLVLALDPRLRNLKKEILDLARATDAKEFKEFMKQFSGSSKSDAASDEKSSAWTKFYKENAVNIAKGGRWAVIGVYSEWSKQFDNLYEEQQTRVTETYKDLIRNVTNDLTRETAKMQVKSPFEAWILDMKEFDEQTGRYIEFTKEKLNELREAFVKKENMEMIKDFATGVADIFMNMIRDIRDIGFKGLFSYILQGFSELIFQMAVKWLQSQLYLSMISFIGSIFGGGGGKSASFSGGDAAQTLGSIVTSSNPQNYSSNFVNNTNRSTAFSSTTAKTATSTLSAINNVTSMSSAISKAAFSNYAIGPKQAKNLFQNSENTGQGDIEQTTYTSMLSNNSNGVSDNVSGTTIVINQTFNINTQNAESFRRSETSILSDAHKAARKAFESVN